MAERATPYVLAHRGFCGPTPPTPDDPLAETVDTSGGESVDGAAGETAHRAVENSLTAFARAASLGCQWVETDVRATADGVLLTFHDDRIDRLTSQRGAIAELTSAQLQHIRLHDGEPVPTLREAMERFPQLHFNIDVKSTDAVAPLAALITALGAHDRVRIASFSDRRRRRVLAGLDRPVRSSPGQRVLTLLWLCSRLGPRTHRVFRWIARDVDCLQVPHRYGRFTVADQSLIRTAHAAGKEVHVWTVNHPADMQQLLDIGVDALITDRADRALAVIAQHADAGEKTTRSSTSAR